MTCELLPDGTSIYFASVSRYLKNTFIGLGLTAFFALFQFIPFQERPHLRIFGYVAIVFFLYLTVFSALRVLVRRPTLILDNKGIWYRISIYRTVFVPWQNVERVAIETSSASYRGKTFSSRFISIYPKNPSSLIGELPLVQRFFAWVSVKMGYSSLFISEPVVNAPLEDVANAINQYAKKFGGLTPNIGFQVTSAPPRSRS